MNTFFWRHLIVVIALFVTSLPAKAQNRRKLCRPIKQECLRGGEMLRFDGFVNFHLPIEQRCDLVYKACLKDELNKSCPEVYKARAERNAKHRNRVFRAGGSILIFGLTVGTTSMLANGFGGVSIIPGLGILLIGSSVGGLLIGLSQIPSRIERVEMLYTEDRQRKFGFTPFYKQKNRQTMLFEKRLERLNDDEELNMNIINAIFHEKMERGDFCQNYPRLAGPRQVMKEVLQEYKNSDVIGELASNRSSNLHKLDWDTSHQTVTDSQVGEL